MPEHLVADEKHIKILGYKTYVATTVGNGCVLGVAIATDAGEESLTRSYGIFKDEAQCIKPGYSPKTVNTDGWLSTQNAWKTLFPYVFLIACFLYIYIKIRNQSKKKCKDIYDQVVTRLWACYEPKNKASFPQRVKRLYAWAKKTSIPCFITKNCETILHLFSAQYLHGFLFSAFSSLDSYE